MPLREHKLTTLCKESCGKMLNISSYKDLPFNVD